MWQGRPVCASHHHHNHHHGSRIALSVTQGHKVEALIMWLHWDIYKDGSISLYTTQINNWNISSDKRKQQQQTKRQCSGQGGCTCPRTCSLTTQPRERKENPYQGYKISSFLKKKVKRWVNHSVLESWVLSLVLVESIQIWEICHILVYLCRRL